MESFQKIYTAYGGTFTMLTQHYIGVRMSVLFDFLSTLEELKKCEGRCGAKVDVMWALNIFVLVS